MRRGSGQRPRADARTTVDGTTERIVDVNVPMTTSLGLGSLPAPRVALVELNRPDKRNALSAALVSELGRTLQETAARDDVRALVLTGRGSGFCAGADLAEFDRILGPTAADAVAGVGRYNDLAETLARLSVPTVAAVNGAAVGGGAGLALLCDIRILASSAQLWVNQVRRAIVPDIGLTWTLPRLVGASRATAWSLLAEPVDEPTALLAGLAYQVVADDQLVAAAVMLAGRLAELPPLALRLTRAALAESARGDLADALRREALALGVCGGEPGFFPARDPAEAAGGVHRADERADLPRDAEGDR
jgi:2-(1,2-epoxy-1,2-dihydrophenyl)acetyl-CoA isomerase